jgi:hypothetical protein
VVVAAVVAEALGLANSLAWNVFSEVNGRWSNLTQLLIVEPDPRTR